VDNLGKNVICFVLIIAKIFLLSKNFFRHNRGLEDSRQTNFKYLPKTEGFKDGNNIFWDFPVSLNFYEVIR